MLIRSVIHLVLHAIVPAIVARQFYRNMLWKAWLIMLATMLIDLDHLLADPIFDANRCSIGFHPLHQYPVIAACLLALAWPRTRLIAIGLVIHMSLDGIDCLWMRYEN